MPTKNRIGTGEFFIFHTQDLQEAHAIASSSSTWTELIEFINEPRYTAKDTAIPYRSINHWSELGLLEDDRETEGVGWRKLTFKQVVWLKIISELRLFGFPLEGLKSTFKSLFFIKGKRSDKIIELVIALCISKNPQSVFLVVFQDGQAEIASLADLRATDELVGHQHSFIRLNLNTLLSEAFGTPKFMSQGSPPNQPPKKK